VISCGTPAVSMALQPPCKRQGGRDPPASPKALAKPRRKSPLIPSPRRAGSRCCPPTRSITRRPSRLGADALWRGFTPPRPHPGSPGRRQCLPSGDWAKCGGGDHRGRATCRSRYPWASRPGRRGASDLKKQVIRVARPRTGPWGSSLLGDRTPSAKCFTLSSGQIGQGPG